MDAKTGDIGGCPMKDTKVRSLLGRTNKDWWPEALPVDMLHQHGASPDPMGDGLRLCRGLQQARLPGAESGPDRADDRQPAMVAGRLWPLRAVLDPHGLARGWDLSQRPTGGAAPIAGSSASLRSIQLAGQRQPRQGAAPAVADQAEVRPVDQLGRPVHPRRQCRHRIDGRAGVRLRRRPQGRLSSRRATSIWGAEENWVNAGRQDPHQPEELPELEGPLAAIQMGLIYVNPGRAGRQSRPAAVGARHQVDLPAHGDESGRDSRAHRRRPRLRQGARRGPAETSAPRRRRGHPPAGPRLAQRMTSGSASTPSPAGIEGAWSNNPTKWAENYFRLLFKYEYELVTSPAGAQQWQPINPKPEDMAPDARDPSKRVPTMMTTADMALKMDPEFRAISERFRDDQGRSRTPSPAPGSS